MATVLTKKLFQDTIETIQQVYMEDNIPWICGYSGGKDSSAVVLFSLGSCCNAIQTN